MQIAFHIGANCTDEDRLLKSILKNADALLQQGVSVPGPSKYRRLIRETIQTLDGGHPAPDTRDILIDAITEDEDVSRLVMSNDNFIAVPKRIFDHDIFYPQAETKVRGLRQLFPEDDLSLYLGLRNPASFLQETYKRAQPSDLKNYLGRQSAFDLTWTDVIRRIKLAAPAVPLTVWCNEDTPLIWEDLIRHVSGISNEAEVIGCFDLISQIVTAEGLATLKEALDRPTEMEATERHEIIADVLEKHALPDADDDVITLPELDADAVAEITENYEDDLTDIQQMNGVRLILPFE